MRCRTAIERSLCALLLCSLAAQARGMSARVQDTFEQVQTAAQAGEFAAALELAHGATDPLVALRAEVWLQFRARDFVLAQQVAERALQRSPQELWLAERALACALWRGDPRSAQLGLSRLEQNFQRASPEEREGFAVALAQSREATSQLLGASQNADSAATRARAVALTLLSAALACLAFLAHHSVRDARSKLVDRNV